MDTEQTRPLMTRIPPEMVPRIDAQRGDVPRERWIRRRLEEVLDAQESQTADRDRTLSA